MPESVIDPHKSGFNVPMSVFSVGSYFGDQECLTANLFLEEYDDKKYYR